MKHMALSISLSKTTAVCNVCFINKHVQHIQIICNDNVVLHWHDVASATAV